MTDLYHGNHDDVTVFIEDGAATKARNTAESVFKLFVAHVTSWLACFKNKLKVSKESEWHCITKWKAVSSMNFVSGRPRAEPACQRCSASYTETFGLA